VASSKIETLGFGDSARAIAIRCLWPPDELVAPSSETESYGEGQLIDKILRHQPFWRHGRFPGEWHRDWMPRCFHEWFHGIRSSPGERSRRYRAKMVEVDFAQIRAIKPDGSRGRRLDALHHASRSCFPDPDSADNPNDLRRVRT